MPGRYKKKASGDLLRDTSKGPWGSLSYLLAFIFFVFLITNTVTRVDIRSIANISVIPHVSPPAPPMLAQPPSSGTIAAFGLNQPFLNESSLSLPPVPFEFSVVGSVSFAWPAVSTSTLPLQL